MTIIIIHLVCQHIIALLVLSAAIVAQDVKIIIAVVISNDLKRLLALRLLLLLKQILVTICKALKGCRQNLVGDIIIVWLGTLMIVEHVV